MAKDSFVLIFYKIFRNVISVFFVVVLTRALTINQYGTYRQCFMIANIVNLVLLLGINESLLYYYRIVEKEEKSKIVTAVISIKVVAAIIAVILLNVFSSEIAGGVNNKLVEDYMLIISLITVAILLSSILESLYISNNDVVFYSWFTTGFYFTYYVMATIIIFITKNEKYVMQLFIVFEFSRSIFLLIKFYKNEKLKISINFNVVKYILGFALPIGVAMVVISLNREIDKFMIAYFYDTANYAIYSNATITLPIVEFIVISIGVVILPKMSEMMKSDGIEASMAVFKKAAVYCAMVVYPIIAIFSVFGEGYILLMFGERYVEAFPILRMYFLRLLITIGLYNTVLMLIDRKKKLIIISVIALVSNFILNVVLIKLIGMIGAAIASVIAQLISESLILNEITHHSAIRINDIFDWKKIFLVILSCSIPVAVFGFVAMMMEWSKILEFIIFGLGTSIAVVFFYFKTGLLDMDVIKSLKTGDMNDTKERSL